MKRKQNISALQRFINFESKNYPIFSFENKMYKAAVSVGIRVKCYSLDEKSIIRIPTKWFSLDERTQTLTCARPA